jgi:hypothetical protein
MIVILAVADISGRLEKMFLFFSYWEQRIFEVCEVQCKLVCLPALLRRPTN